MDAPAADGRRRRLRPKPLPTSRRADGRSHRRPPSRTDTDEPPPAPDEPRERPPDVARSRDRRAASALMLAARPPRKRAKSAIREYPSVDESDLQNRTPERIKPWTGSRASRPARRSFSAAALLALLLALLHLAEPSGRLRASRRRHADAGRLGLLGAADRAPDTGRSWPWSSSSTRPTSRSRRTSLGRRDARARRRALRADAPEAPHRRRLGVDELPRACVSRRAIARQARISTGRRTRWERQVSRLSRSTRSSPGPS